MSEKGPLDSSQPARPRQRMAYQRVIAVVLLTLYGIRCWHYGRWFGVKITHTHKNKLCPVQPPALDVGSSWDILHDWMYADLAASRLSQAVQIRTESFDDLPTNASDPAWEKHDAFAHFLEVEFPKVYGATKHESVNSHGHLFTWSGSKPDLQPILLMAHIDTVPVLEDTVGLWTYPPFEGIIAVNGTKTTPGTWIWGRGSSDCKNQVMGIMGSVERLVTEGFKPERTILIAFGFDEEIGGFRGAGHLGHLLEERYGPNSLAFLVDEGFSGISREYGSTIAALGMAEKGRVDVELKLETPGGHSSVPPVHTGIGLMSLLIAELEAHPPTPELVPESPILKYLSCLEENAPHFPHSLRNRLLDPKKWPGLAKDLAKDRMMNSFLATSQAFDLIRGGVKVNALPEVVRATADYRISFSSSVQETLDYVVSTLTPKVKSLGLTMSTEFPSKHKDSKKSLRHLTLAVTANGVLEPAPITPSDGKSFAFMAGTIKTVFGNETIVAPTGMFANTDTRHYWNLTQNFYRFSPGYREEEANEHTVDERVSLNYHLNTTNFYYKLIQNSIGWDA